MNDKKNWDLYFAASDGNVEEIQRCLQNKAHVNWSNPHSGRTPLHIATQKGHVSAVQELLKVPGINVDIQTTTAGATALMLAARFGQGECVLLLVDAGTDKKSRNHQGKRAVDIAQENRHTDLLSALEPPPEPEKEPVDIYTLKKYNHFYLPDTAAYVWTKETLEEIEQSIEVISLMKSAPKIEEDSKSLSEMLRSAEAGQWHLALEIIQDKPYLINVISEEKAWSALHQAVYQNNIFAVTTLLSYPNCDVHVKAKRDEEGKGQPGCTPIDLATWHNCHEAKALLEDHESKRERFDVEFHTFVDKEKGEKYIKEGIPYFLLGIAFLNEEMLAKLDIDHKKSYLDLTASLFELLVKHWCFFKDAISECLMPFDVSVAASLKDQDDLESFLSDMLKVYTTGVVYRQVNKALRKTLTSSEDDAKVAPLLKNDGHGSELVFYSGDDLLLCLYSLFLHSIILHWDQLQRPEDTTFRGAILSREQMELYQNDTSFVWLPFTSSSTEEQVTKAFGDGFHDDDESHSVLFIIDNHRESTWRPCELASFSAYRCEEEVVYPAGAQFRVTRADPMQLVTDPTDRFKRVFVELVNLF